MTDLVDCMEEHGIESSGYDKSVTFCPYYEIAADLLAALELAGHTTAMCSNDSELTPTAKEGRGLCERCAAIAVVKGD